MTHRPMMHLVAIPNMVGGHLGGWRHRDAFDDSVMNLDAVLEMARLAERGKFDAVFLADGNGVREMERPALFAANFPSARPAMFEPTTLLSAVAMATSRLGLVATATSTFDEPWMVARRFSSMDHISRGRAGWNLVTASNSGDALNFSRTEVGREDRYARAEEFYEVVAALWDSWAPDAFPQDKATGRYLDPARVASIDHAGAHFRVKGPLSLPPTPQGRPVVFMAGQSAPGMELAARHADALFGAGSTKEDCIGAYADIKGRMGKYGRDPDSLKILPDVSIFTGPTNAEAEQLYEELQSLISPTLGVHYLSKQLTCDLGGCDVDGPVPSDIPAEVAGGSSLRRYMLDMIRREDLTVRQAYERLLPAIGGPMFKGSPAEVADTMEDWWRARAGDGFTVMAPVQPRGLRDVVELVVPELQRRGLFRTEYEHATLRGHLGLPDAPSRWSAR
ncbi:MAG: LLM class flavin-dependent oxidoreductase [Janthinobacterium lividum]